MKSITFTSMAQTAIFNCCCFSFVHLIFSIYFWELCFVLVFCFFFNILGFSTLLCLSVLSTIPIYDLCATWSRLWFNLSVCLSIRPIMSIYCSLYNFFEKLSKVRIWITALWLKKSIKLWTGICQLIKWCPVQPFKLCYEVMKSSTSAKRYLNLRMVWSHHQVNHRKHDLIGNRNSRIWTRDHRVMKSPLCHLSHHSSSTHFYHLNTVLVRNLHPHCILNKKDPNKIIFTIFGNFKILCLSVSPYSCLYVTILLLNYRSILSFFYPSLDVFFAAWICFKIVRLPWASPLLNLVTMLTSQLSTIFKYSKQKQKSGII